MKANPKSHHENDLELTETALAGDEGAVLRIQEIVTSPKLRGLLVHRGASSSEAEDIVHEILGDCFAQSAPTSGMRRLLDKYNGTCPLEGFIHRVAMNRLIDRKRHQEVVNRSNSPESREDVRDLTTGRVTERSEDQVVLLIVEAMRTAFSRVDQEKLVLFRLKHSYGLSQRDLARMWRCHESTIGRQLADVAADVKRHALSDLHESDAWLSITWEDIEQLCRESLDLFEY